MPRHGILQKAFTLALTLKSALRSKRMPPKLSLAGGGVIKDMFDIRHWERANSHGTNERIK